ncbi:VOC family protein [Granulicella arctica]|uniref:Catechol 2,3-dioxygenase-like lactoylglutathione lyase family enzyme n=1 Tax=Granulicella arctica TaxID=940613 RepID=A0A7Y9PH50_9BACT|nr:VOC family protein [Granulicella arctica]NYF79086.1 catechol 2,3-dioxygenase-like lactoylglutathione lyase family enzyme [Granulicella arctica]
MLDDCSVMGFIPTKDAAKARAFYVDLLGLTLVSEDPFATEVLANGTHIRITNVPDFTPFSFTLLGWRVADITASVAEMASKGVAFERYPRLEQDAHGIWTAPGGARIAWFKDPDGNTLSLSQH